MIESTEVAEVAVVIALLAQFAGLVWGASAIKTAVDSLKQSVMALSRTVEKLDDKVDDHEARVRVLEHVA